jgi:hypothetical protein
MRVFLSYASEDRAIVEEVQLAITAQGHQVFFDKESLPAGGDYHTRIREAIAQTDLFIILRKPGIGRSRFLRSDGAQIR